MKLGICVVLLSFGFAVYPQNFWQSTNEPSRLPISSIAVKSASTVFIGTQGDGIYRSNDTGKNWAQVNTGLTNTFIQTIAVNSSGTVFAGTMAGIYRSNDNGNSWVSIDNGITAMMIWAYAITVSPAGTLFVGVDGGGAYRSVDSGDNWVQVIDGFPSDNFLVYGFETRIAGRVFAGVNGAICCSYNNGGSWAVKKSGMGSGVVSSFAVGKTGSVFAGMDGGGLYRSNDSGNTWKQLDTGLVSKYVKCITINSAGVIYVGTGDAGVFYSSDNGDTWASLNTGLGSGQSVYSLGINPTGTLYAGTEGSGFFRSASSTVSKVTDKPEQLSCELLQNYPNPFNPGTTISFTLPIAGHVSVKVYDVLGKEVKNLSEGYMPAGKHTVYFNGEKLSSGVYYYVLKANDEFIMKKMILMK